MILLDANPLLYALREDVPEYPSWHPWLEDLINTDTSFAVCNFTFASVVRISTGRRVFKNPTPLAEALGFVDAIRESPSFFSLEPGPQHWTLVNRLCRATRATGSILSDVYLAALAMEVDAVLMTADRDFARFPGLRFSNPLADL